MKTISRNFETLQQAELYQRRLYERYNHARLIDYPSYTENGTYTWEVKDEIIKKETVRSKV